MATFKQLTDYFQRIGATQVAHTSKSYLAHGISVHNDLKAWGADDDVARAGLFHSIYGTERFNGFTLPLDKRSEVQALIGERAEHLAWLNCVIDRTWFDGQARRETGPYQLQNRLTGEQVNVSERDFHDLCTIHLCDWLEQVARSQDWTYRRAAYAHLAERLGGVAAESFARVYADHPEG